MTGGNRGIGLEVCRQLARRGLSVVLAARDLKAGREASQRLAQEGLETRVERLDVSDEDSIRACAHRLEEAGIRVDALVNNAAISAPGEMLTSRSLEAAMATNFLGAVRMCRAFVPAMEMAGYGRVVNVSSGCGSFAEGLGCLPAYAISKAALNAFTVRLSREVKGDIKVNAACPGWVRTAMGGPEAPRDAGQGADTIVWLATIGADGPTGGFFRDRKSTAW